MRQLHEFLNTQIVELDKQDARIKMRFRTLISYCHELAQALQNRLFTNPNIPNPACPSLGSLIAICQLLQK